MLAVFICEDDPAQRARMEKIITDYIMIENFDMELTLSTSDPYDILTYLEHSPGTRGVYFLDVDLGQDINGIQLGAYIRDKDLNGKIVFITTHSELLVLTFTYKVEAMDYILKDNPTVIQTKVYEALIQAQKHYQREDKLDHQRIKLTIANQVRVFPLDDVMFIETSPTPHKLVLHLTNSTVEFYGKITDMPQQSPYLLISHKSYVVNIQNIRRIDKTNRKLTMKNGEHSFYSIRKLKQIEEALQIDF